MTGYWTTKEGKEIPYNKLEDSHLLNILKYIKRLAKNGLLVERGVGVDETDMDYYVDSLFGKEVLELLDYKNLLKEAKKRGLK